MKKIILFSFLLASLCINSFASGQEPDLLFYEGKILPLFSNPLENFYNNEKKRPAFTIAPNTFRSTNSRGYVAFWEIIDDSLYLKGVDSWVCGETVLEKASEKTACQKADIKQLFDDRYIQNRVFAKWFTGELRMPQGEIIRVLSAGYGSIYERDFIISVRDGKITGKKIIDNTKK